MENSYLIHDDYIMRMIEQFSLVLAKIFFNKRINPQETLFELDRISGKFLGLDRELLNSFSVEDIINFFNVNNNLDITRCLMAAEILREEAIIFEKQQKSDKLILSVCAKSLRLYDEAFWNSNVIEIKDYKEKITGLIEKWKNLELPSDLKLTVFRFLEKCGDYNKAENILYELLQENNEDSFKAGIAFYKRLLEMNDEQLNKGNLPRDEVKEGLARL